MSGTLSLRVRLTAIILIPLLVIAGLIGFWAIGDARERADARFNRALLSAALAVSRDVAVSDGDALSPETNRLLRDTSGGEVFYHVRAPDGVFVTGYATPPVPLGDTVADRDGQPHFDGLHQSRQVRALRFVDTMQVDGLSGDFTITVWQDSTLYAALVRDLSMRSFRVMGVLVLTVALVVWFGVRFGLRPLTDLEQAIAQRNSSDLSPIRRSVPVEVGGIVGTLNRLFGQVSDSMTVQSEFIANAAHQLRNPIAGVLSLAEAVARAPDPAETRARASDLLDAARETADLSQKLLMLERAEALTPTSEFRTVDLANELPALVQTLRRRLPEHVQLASEIASDGLRITGDMTMLREAVTNLVDNAVRHGGSELGQITLSADRSGDHLRIRVSDDGQGIPEAEIPQAMKRFVRLSETSSSGLGLALVQAIARGHGGELRLEAGQVGLAAELVFPAEALR